MLSANMLPTFTTVIQCCKSDISNQWQRLCTFNYSNECMARNIVMHRFGKEGLPA